MSAASPTTPDESRSALRLSDKRQVPSSLLLPPAISPRASLSSPLPSPADRRGSFSALHALFSSSTRDLTAPDITDQIEKLHRILHNFKKAESTLQSPDDKVILDQSWTEIVNSCDQQSMSKRDRNRQEAIWELLQTERAYIRSLQTILDHFAAPLAHVQREQLLVDVEYDRLFWSLGALVGAHRVLWEDHLRPSLDCAARTGRALTLDAEFIAGFNHISEVLDIYENFCARQSDCMAYLRQLSSDNEIFRSFLSWAEAEASQECRRQRLADLLVMPMQRLTRYSLLLNAVLRQTDPDDADQVAALQSMLANVDAFVGRVNERVRERERRRNLETLAARFEGADLLDRAAFSEECVSVSDVYLVLLNDLLLFARPSGSAREKGARHERERDCQPLLRLCRPPLRLESTLFFELGDPPGVLVVSLAHETHVAVAAYQLLVDTSAFLESVKITQSDRIAKCERLGTLSQSDALFMRVAMMSQDKPPHKSLMWLHKRGGAMSNSLEKGSPSTPPGDGAVTLNGVRQLSQSARNRFPHSNPPTPPHNATQNSNPSLLSAAPLPSDIRRLSAESGTLRAIASQTPMPPQLQKSSCELRQTLCARLSIGMETHQTATPPSSLRRPSATRTKLKSLPESVSVSCAVADGPNFLSPNSLALEAGVLPEIHVLEAHSPSRVSPQASVPRVPPEMTIRESETASTISVRRTSPRRSRPQLLAEEDESFEHLPFDRCNSMSEMPARPSRIDYNASNARLTKALCTPAGTRRFQLATKKSESLAKPQQRNFSLLNLFSHRRSPQILSPNSQLPPSSSKNKSQKQHSYGYKSTSLSSFVNLECVQTATKNA